MKLTNYISEAIDNMAKYENIENIGKLIKNGAVAELSKRISVAEKTASDILKKLNELEKAARQKRAEEEIAAYEAEHGALAPIQLNMEPPVFGWEGYGPEIW